MSLVLSIKLLGGFSLTYGDRPLTESISGRQQTLLAYLALHHQTAHPRQRLAFHFWPDSTDERSRANLRKELSLLRKALPNADEYLSVTAKALQWNPSSPFTLDTAEFEAALKAAELVTEPREIKNKLEQALELYRGEFLPDSDYEWVFPERERLHQLYVRALERLIHHLKEQHNYSTAVTYAQQLLRVDEVNESAYGVLIELYGLMGDRASGLQTYHQCMTILREELGVDPSATTRKFYEQLLREDEESNPFRDVPVPSAQLKVPLAPIIGRDQEWEIIEQWVDSILPLSKSAMISDLLLLVGEPGIGKTRLLEELGTAAQADQVQVLWGSGFAAEMMRPYGFWIDVLRSGNVASTNNLSDALGALLPELGQPAQALPDPSYLYDAVVNLLTQWTTVSPLLLLLDDIQWLDEASSALLNYLIRVMRHTPVAFACTARSGELAANSTISKVLQTLRREQRLQTIEVLPLSEAKTIDLIQSHGHHASTDGGHQLFIDSGGNPLLALEIARSMGRDQGKRKKNEAVICYGTPFC